MKIRGKLFISFFVILLIGLILGTLGFFSTYRLTVSSENLLNLAETRSHISSILGTHYNWRHGLSETVYTGAAFGGSLNPNTCSLGQWMNGEEVKRMTDPESISKLSQIVEPHRFIHEKAGEIINLLNNDENEEAIHIFKEEILPRTQEVISGLGEMDSRYGVLLENNINEAHADGVIFEFIIIIFAIIAVIASIVLAILITSSIVKPIKKMTGTFAEIGKGNLTAKTEIKSKDEMKEFSNNINLAMGNVKSLVLTIKNEAAKLQNIGNDLASNMTETAAAVNEITANVQSIKSRVLNQSASVTETNATMEQVVTNIKKLNGHVDDQSTNIAQASSAIEQMVANTRSVTDTLIKNAANVKALTEASEVGRGGLQEVSADIQEIARESEGLLEINAVMENIASQTNLLSMNAAIEAAHAGEAGKGFAVVAEEIRKLAESSSEQSKTISIVLKKIKASIDKITSSTENVLNKFEAIDSSVRTVADQEEIIRNAMEEQGIGSKQILEGVGNVNEITRQVKTGSTQMQEGAQEVIKESVNLEKITQEITSGMNEMALGSDEINSAVNAVNDISGKNRDAINVLLEEVKRFKVE